jgi:hypothetical protein
MADYILSLNYDIKKSYSYGSRPLLPQREKTVLTWSQATHTDKGGKSNWATDRYETLRSKKSGFEVNYHAKKDAMKFDVWSWRNNWQTTASDLKILTWRALNYSDWLLPQTAQTVARAEALTVLLGTATIPENEYSTAEGRVKRCDEQTEILACIH